MMVQVEKVSKSEKKRLNGDAGRFISIVSRINRKDVRIHAEKIELQMDTNINLKLNLKMMIY